MRHQFCDRKHIADLRAGSHATIVISVRIPYNSVRIRTRGSGLPASARSRRSKSQTDWRSLPAPPIAPATASTPFRFRPDVRTRHESRVRSARRGELRCDFGEAGHDHARGRTRHQNRPRACPSDQSGHIGRQRKDAAANDRVDHQRGQSSTRPIARTRLIGARRAAFRFPSPRGCITGRSSQPSALGVQGHGRPICERSPRSPVTFGPDAESSSAGAPSEFPHREQAVLVFNEDPCHGGNSAPLQSEEQPSKLARPK